MSEKYEPPGPRVRRLYASPMVAIDDVRCDGRDGASCEECSLSHQIAFVRRGAFARWVRGEETLVDAGSALFFARDEPYRVRHPAGGDACTSLVWSDAGLRDVLEHVDPASLARDTAPFPVAQVACEADVHLAHQKLRHALASGGCEPLLVEELALALTGSALRAAARAPLARPARGSARSHRELAEAAKTVLARRLRERPSLGEVARAVGCSPFHLARVFRGATGTPLHRHLARLRLREALARMLDGERDLTGLALDLGFFDHAHFTNAFHREFGLSPSRARERTGAAELRALSKNLQA